MDDCDLSDGRIAHAVEIALDQARRAPALPPNGKCYFCGECVTGKLLFCGANCRDDFAAEEEAMKRAGRR